VSKITPKQPIGSTKKMTGVRLSEQERQALEKEANELGITLSEYIRERLKDSSQLDRIEKKIDELKKIVSKK
jgi:macrodomain Ter protein organizer (MatP/YcbG family)